MMEAPVVEFEDLRCDKATEIIFSIIAVFAWVVLFAFCPLLNAWKEIKDRDSEEALPIYVIVALFCYEEFSLVYVLYVIQKPSYPFHYDCLQYVACFTCLIALKYIELLAAPRPECCSPRSTWDIFWIVIAGVSSILTAVLLFFPRFDGVMKYVRFVSIILGVFAYASPLPMLIKISRKNIIPRLPIYLSTACLFNGLAWLSVSLLQLTFDPYLMITNGIGVLLGISQLGVILISKYNLKVYPVNSDFSLV